MTPAGPWAQLLGNGDEHLRLISLGFEIAKLLNKLLYALNLAPNRQTESARNLQNIWSERYKFIWD